MSIPLPVSRIALPSLILALTLATPLGVEACSMPSQGRVVAEPTLQEQLRRAFEDSARANHVIGAQLAVSMPDGSFWTFTYGNERPGVPMTDDVLLGTGSISKMLAAVSVLRLVDQGAVSLDDTLGTWFSDLPNVPPSIPVRALLWHQSGLPEYADVAGFADSIRADPSREWTPDELARFIGPPSFAPGSQWRASNSDRLLLGMIVARTTGKAYGAYLDDQLLAGLRGEHWTPGQVAAPAHRIATHWAGDGSTAPIDFSAQYFGPSLFTARLESYVSARELAQLARRLFDGDLLSARGRATLLTIVPDDGRIAGETGGGVGIRRFEYGGRVMYGNSGATANSSALYLYDPGTKVIVSLSTNQSGPSHGQSHFRTVPALLRMANAFVLGTR